MAEDYGFSDPNLNPDNDFPVNTPQNVGNETSQDTSRIVQNLINARPDWQMDGLGLRGPQPERQIAPIPRPPSTRVRFNEKHAQDSGGGGAMSVADEAVGDFAEGETLVDPVDKITFDNRYFKIHDNGGGEVQVSLITDTCT